MSFSPLILRSQAGSRSAHPGRLATALTCGTVRVVLLSGCEARIRELPEEPALALDARDGADDRIRESAIDHLGVALRLRCEGGDRLRTSILEETPTSCTG